MRKTFSLLSFSFKVLILSGLIFIASCKKDPELPDNLVSFETNNLGFAATENEVTLNLKLSYAATVAGNVIVNAFMEDIVYDKDITTLPAISSTAISIPIVSGDLAKTIKITKKPGVLFDGTESIKFTIASVPSGLKIGVNPEIKINFSEIVSAGASATTIDGGGTLYPNKVFIDLSANRMSSYPRLDFDLGFASGADYRVILNAANGMLAYATTKNDLTQVNAADTVGLTSRFSLNAIFSAITGTDVPSWISGTPAWIDEPNGNLAKTSISEISVSDTSNKVYIINQGMGVGAPAPALPWKKIRILRKGNGYLVQHADINSNTFAEITVNKNDTYNFQYIDFEKGVVTVDPPKDKWDICWTGFTNLTNLGAGLVPYYFQDVIVQNTYKVQTAQILNTTKPYENFGAADLSSLDFGTQSQIKIGSNWRSGGGPTSAPAIRNDRYYIIKDPAGNVYKLKFIALDSNGERGKPRFEYSLIK